MDKPEISSTANPLVKRVRSLRQRKGRQETGAFVVEGLHHVGEAIEAGWEVEAILYAPEVLSSSFGSTLVAQNPALAQRVSGAVMDSLADKDNPQGMLAVVKMRHFALAALEGRRRLVGMVSPQDPGNVGTVLRTMDAVGADGLVLLDGGVDPYHPTSVRASMGTLFWTPVVQAGFAEFTAWARAQALHVIGSSAHADNDYRGVRPVQPWLLLLGSEQKGLTPEHMAVCETLVSLPMRGRASSLNLAVAAGILLYHLIA